MSPITFVCRLIRWFRGHVLAVAVITGCLLVDMAFNAFLPLAFQHLIDDAIIPRNSTLLLRILVALGIAVLLTTATGMLSDYVYARVSAGVLGDIRQKLFDHLQTLSPSFYQKYSAGEISARYSSDLAGVEQTLNTWIPWGWKPALDVLGYNLVIFVVDWRLGLLSQLLWPMVLLGPRFFAPHASRAASECKSKEGALLSAVDEATAGRNVVRAFGLEGAMSERFARLVRSLVATSRRGAFFNSALERSATIGMLFLQIVILGVGAAMTFDGEISVGGLAAFYSVFISLSAALFYLAQYSTTLISSAAGLSRIDAILRETPAVADAPDARTLPLFRHTIQLRDCVYSPEPGRRILDGVSLTIRHGESVAFVGPSGSGKSTLLNAIMRSFDPDSGAVEIDGHDLRTVTKASFIRQSAVVFQESFLYHASIRENLRLGRLDATDAEIEAACRDAEIHDFIAALPRGYDSPVGERGALLSGGQRQRLAIARALLRNPRILFLDEATSGLDLGTEVAINQTLARLAQGRTVLTVTHHLATVTHCDRIFVMQQGRIAEAGSHPELLDRGGPYASLWYKQEGINTNEDGSRAHITVERLKQFALLAPLGDDLLRDLVTEQFITENIPANRDVIVEGDLGGKFYIIARGQVEVLKKDASGHPRRVCILEVGDNFGELAQLRDTPRNATIRTLNPCIFLTLERKHFLNLIAHSPSVRATISAQESERTRATGSDQNI